MGSAPLMSALRMQLIQRRDHLRLLWNVGISVGGVVLARFLGAVTQIVLSRQLGVDGFGLYTALYTLLGVVVIFSSFGFDTWLLRQTSLVESPDRLINDVFSLRLYATLLLMGVGIGFILITKQPGMTLTLSALTAITLTLELLLTTAQTALRAQIKNNLATIIQVVVAALFIAALLLSHGADKDILWCQIYRLGAALLGVLLVILLMRDRLRLTCSLRRFVQIVVSARTYFFSDILANIALKADLTFVTLMIGSLASAIYSPALTIINTTFIVPSVVAQVVLPILSRPALARKRFLIILIGFLLGSALYGIFWFVALEYGSPWIITTIWGDEYRQAIPLLQIMSLIPLMKSLNFCWVTIMVAYDRQWLRTKLQAFGSIANMAGNLIWIPIFGLVGAAWVNLGTEVILLLCYGYGAYSAYRKANR